MQSLAMRCLSEKLTGPLLQPSIKKLKEQEIVAMVGNSSDIINKTGSFTDMDSKSEGLGSEMQKHVEDAVAKAAASGETLLETYVLARLLHHYHLLVRCDFASAVRLLLSHLAQRNVNAIKHGLTLILAM